MQSNKDLLAHLFKQMELLDKNKISIDTAKEMANLAKQANNSMKFELERTSLMLKIEQAGSALEIRDIEK